MKEFTCLLMGGVAGAVGFGVGALVPHQASAEVLRNREATVFIQNDVLAEKLGTRFLEECEASQRDANSHVEVTCWGAF